MPILSCQMLAAHLGRPRKPRGGRFLAFGTKSLDGSEHLLRSCRDCRFTMIQVWQAEHSATIVRLDSRFAHDDGLQCRSSRNTVSSARVQARITRGRNRIVLGFPSQQTSEEDHGHQQSRDSKEGIRTAMGTRDRKARLPVLEKAHAPTAGLSYMQAQITNPKTSMSVIACFRQRS